MYFVFLQSLKNLKGNANFGIFTSDKLAIHSFDELKYTHRICMYVCMLTEGSARPSVVPSTYF